MNIGIYGYGNLGRGVETAAHAAGDNIVGIFTRRPPAVINSPFGTPVYDSADVERFSEGIDVLAVCGGSATDLPAMTPTLARSFNVVDSYDNHAEMKIHVRRVDEAARESGHSAIVGCGWDPGLFSLLRAYFGAFFPRGNVTTYWGRGVSQGHSDAVRRIDGVADAREYTVPRKELLTLVRRDGIKLTSENLHRREVYVVPEDGADTARIAAEIRLLDGYFKGYETEVKFITREEMARDHRELPHGGGIIASNRSGARNEYRSTAEFTLMLDSNPCFTGGIMLAYANAALNLFKRGEYGCKTVLDVCAMDILRKNNKTLDTADDTMI